VVAHPDDETIGMGGLLPELKQPVLVHLTGGSPADPAAARNAGFPTPEDYAQARRREFLAAIQLAGIPPERAWEIGLTDQQVGLHLVEAARRLASIFAATRPVLVFTHPYEGGHPDHDATAFAVHAACRLTADPPAILEFTSYHSGDGAMETGRFLPGATDVTEISLSEDARCLKRKMFDCFDSQRQMLSNFPIGTERFRPAPEYDFTVPPHAGQLFYEQFDWGMTGERFRALARQALRALEPGD
jgi:LmbE family N-acetylglucosaminyl deacetylase